MAHPAVMGLNSWGCEGNTTLSVLFFPFREATPIALRFRVLGEIPTLANTVDVSRRRPSSACIDFHTFRVAPISTPRDSKASGVLAN